MINEVCTYVCMCDELELVFPLVSTLICSLIGTGLSTCSPCEIGRFANVTSLPTCTYCPEGTFQNSTGSNACTPCALGYYTSTQGAITCRPCKSGTFANTTGSASCTPCPIGMYSISDSVPTGLVQCSYCDLGMCAVSISCFRVICEFYFCQQLAFIAFVCLFFCAPNEQEHTQIRRVLMSVKCVSWEDMVLCKD